MGLLQNRLTPSEVDVLRQIERKLNLSEDEIIQLMRRLSNWLGIDKIENQVKSLEVRQEETLKVLKQIEHLLQKEQEALLFIEKKSAPAEESKIKELESEIKKLDKSYFAECIRQVNNGIQILKRRDVVGPPAAALMYSLEFALLMAIVYVKIMDFNPDFEKHFKEQLTALRTL